MITNYAYDTRLELDDVGRLVKTSTSIVEYKEGTGNKLILDAARIPNVPEGFRRVSFSRQNFLHAYVSEFRVVDREIDK